MKKFAFALYVCLATFFVACGSASEPEDIALEVNKIMQSGNSDDASKIVKYLDLPEKQQDDGTKELISAKLKKGIAKEQAKIEKKGGLKESKIVEVKESGQNRKTVKVLNIYKDDSNDSSNFSFTLRDGEWKLILR